MIPKILLPLSISKIHGLGKKSVQRLNNMGIYIIKDLYPLNKEFFLEYLGKSGLDIYERIRGIDKRIVEVNRDRKSYGRETTACHDYELSEFPIDITEQFFNDYIQNGRCFYLRWMGHKFNIGNEMQEDRSSKKVRICEYCGKKEYSHTWEEVVVRERWE